MKTAITLLASSVLLAACATPIADLNLPAPSTIQGTVSKVEKGGFILTDSTGEVKVDIGDAKLKPALTRGEALTVRGVADEDDSEGQSKIAIKEFDAYDITRSDGSRLVIVPYGVSQ